MTCKANVIVFTYLYSLTVLCIYSTIYCIVMQLCIYLHPFLRWNICQEHWKRIKIHGENNESYAKTCPKALQIQKKHSWTPYDIICHSRRHLSFKFTSTVLKLFSPWDSELYTVCAIKAEMLSGDQQAMTGVLTGTWKGVSALQHFFLVLNQQTHDQSHPDPLGWESRF